jgi:hypothetical protein
MTGPAILTHEKAAGAVAAAADGMTPQEGIEMNTAIIAQDVEIHESLRHLMVDGDYDVRQPNPTHMPLPKGDALWSDQENPRRAKHEEKGESFYLVAVYDLATGERLFEGTRAPLGWWGERIGTFDYQTFGRFHPNTYVRSGAYLFVSGGLWFAVGRPDENGDIAYVSWHASNALVRAGSAERLAAWLAAKAEPISQASPSWADVSLTWAEIVEEDEDDDVDFMQFRRRVGTVVIEQSFNIDDGVFSPASAPQVCIDIVTPDQNVLAIDDVARVGSDLVRAAQLVQGNRAVDVEVFASVGAALGVSGTDLFALAHVDTDPAADVTLSDLGRVARFVGMSPSELYALADRNAQ